MASYNKQIKLNDRKKVAITSYKGKVWLHFRDEAKSKSVSFSKDDFICLLEKLAKIQAGIKLCEKAIKKTKNKKEACDSDDMSFADSGDDDE